jgi:methionyl-tRNA formyltransferase
VKAVADELGLTVHQPHSCRAHDFVETVAGLKPDVIVAVAYGQLIPASVTAKANLAVNVHFSLLPQLRGAAPIQRALEGGFSTTGVTVQSCLSAAPTTPSASWTERSGRAWRR